MTPAAPRSIGLTRYFVVSSVAMVLLGLAIVWVSTGAMQHENARIGAATATSVVTYAVADLPIDELSTVLPAPEKIRSSVGGFADRLLVLRLWSTTGVQLYPRDPGGPGLDEARVEAVIASGEADLKLMQAVGDDGGERAALDVYVPVRADMTAAGPDAGSQIVAVGEVVLDHTEATHALHDAQRTIALVVAGGLLILWLVLYRTVHTSSARLRTTALENARLAMLDSLTGLPNRRLLADRMRRAIGHAHENAGRVGLVLLDVDRFKDINDTLGHDRGDELLEQVAERLHEAVRDDDLVARLGGDEFAILLPELASVQDAERVAQKVHAVFAPPFQLGEMSLHVQTSVGVACLPDHAADASSLMRTADVAMYTAKQHRTGVSVYSSANDDTSSARLVLLGDLHRALQDDSGPELQMHYQPKVDLATGRTVGLEALIRWQHPVRGMLPPGVFVPLAEQSGLIHELTGYALRQCITQLSEWHTQGRTTPVAVNLSAHDVTSERVAETIEHLLADLDVPAQLLEVEITETALVADPSRIVPVLGRLGRLGVRVAIDDFGIGNTSISQLRNLPVDQLKIDKLFIRDLDEVDREGPEVIVQAMVDLAHSFGLEVVAEGVEDERTALLLHRLGVDQAQGYFFARPMPADQLVTLR